MLSEEGYYNMYHTMQVQGVSSTYSSLSPSLTEQIDPVRYIGDVPEEKGYQFLRFTESVLGAQDMQAFL